MNFEGGDKWEEGITSVMEKQTLTSLCVFAVYISDIR